MGSEKVEKYDLIVVCQLFYPELVSTGQTLTELVEELATNGLKIKVIASQPTILSKKEIVPAQINYKGIKIVRTWSTKFPKISFWGKLSNLTSFFISASIEVLLRDRKVPLLLLTNPPFLPILGWMNFIFMKTTYGVLLFDIMPEQAELINLVKTNGLLSKMWRFVNGIWYKKASYVIVLSRDMLNGAIENANLLGKKIEYKCREKTKIIHVWSDDRIIKPTPKSDSSEFRRLKLENKFVIQYSGNHGRFHDVETLLEIVNSLKDKKNIVFQFIGEGFKKSKVNEFISLNNLETVYTSSYVDKEKLSDSLAMADMGVVAQMPGQERVCYPSKLLGIMASGRAVFAICPKQCEMAKMIEEHNLGFVIENGDIESGAELIIKAYENPELIKTMGNNSYRYLKEKFSLELASKMYFDLIKKYQ